MATIRQKKLAKAIAEDYSHANTVGELLENVGYTKSVAKHKPREILEGKGVQQELKEVYGFDPETAKNVVADILIGAEDDGHRLKAADMIFKVHGSYAPEKHQNINVNVDSDIQELADQAAELLRQKKLHDPRTTNNS